MTGFVSLVGAGPGDPELLTLRALRRLREADLVLNDALVHADLLELAPKAQRFYVGKRAGRHSIDQDGINALLIRAARRGQRVVRLKAGDPFVLGRGGEEALALEAANIAYEVVPGVSSAIAAPASAGIPLTARGVAASVAIATGHCARSGAAPLAIPAADTIVVLMGIANAGAIRDQVIASGRSGDTPVAVVEWATCPQQRVVVATLETLPEVIAREGLHAPAVIVIGETVRLRSTLDWRERLAASEGVLVTAR